MSQDLGKLILRLGVAGLLLFHGVDKLLYGIDGIVALMERNGFPGLLAYGVYIGEVLAPLMVIVGFRTRLGALVIALNMMVAILLAHPGDLLHLTKHGAWAIELQALYALGALAVAMLGGGRMSVTGGQGAWD